jgi:hypothetical protein
MKVPWFTLAEAFAVEGAAVFLASDDCPFMTGADLVKSVEAFREAPLMLKPEREW